MKTLCLSFLLSSTFASGTEDWFIGQDLTAPVHYHSWCENSRVIYENHKGEAFVREDCAQKPNWVCVEFETKLHNAIIINAKCQ